MFLVFFFLPFCNHQTKFLLTTIPYHHYTTTSTTRSLNNDNDNNAQAARMLGLRTKGAGGPALEALARDGDPYGVALPVPMQKRKKDCDFSYAGLKNAFRLAVQSAINKEEHDKNNSSGDDSQSDRSSSDRGSSDSSGRYEMNTRNTGTKNVNVEDASGDLPYQVSPCLLFNQWHQE